jgi:hypothetical protein
LKKRTARLLRVQDAQSSVVVRILLIIIPIRSHPTWDSRPEANLGRDLLVHAIKKNRTVPLQEYCAEQFRLVGVCRMGLVKRVTELTNGKGRGEKYRCTLSPRHGNPAVNHQPVGDWISSSYIPLVWKRARCSVKRSPCLMNSKPHLGSHTKKPVSPLPHAHSP